MYWIIENRCFNGMTINWWLWAQHTTVAHQFALLPVGVKLKNYIQLDKPNTIDIYKKYMGAGPSFQQNPGGGKCPPLPVHLKIKICMFFFIKTFASLIFISYNSYYQQVFSLQVPTPETWYNQILFDFLNYSRIFLFFFGFLDRFL